MNELTRFLSDLAFSLLLLVPYMGLGFLVEEFSRRDAVRTRPLLFNLAVTVVYWGFLIGFGSALIGRVRAIAVSLPGSGMLALPELSNSWTYTALMSFAWLAILDLMYYWFHRLQHTSPWLWAQHELHHSDEHMNVTTTWRHHWLETPLQAVFIALPAAYLFRVAAGAATVTYVLSHALSHFTHLDTTISIGPLRRLIGNPGVHRIHHSTRPEHRNKNFAAVFPLWDVLFRTYCDPQGERPPTGLASGQPVGSLRRALVLPFIRWGGMIRSRACPGGRGWITRGGRGSQRRPAPALLPSSNAASERDLAFKVDVGLEAPGHPADVRIRP